MDPRRRTLGVVVEEVARLDRRGLDPAAGLRGAAGVALVLLVGLLAASPASAVAATAGAFSVGVASLQGAYRGRVQATVATSVAMAASTAVGALLLEHDAAAVVITTVWALGAGLATALGPAATVVGLQAGVALLLASTIEMTPREAAVRSLLVLAGGLVQTLLVLAVWPLRSYASERAALGAVYREIGDYARSVQPLPPPSAALTSALEVLADPHPLGRDRTRSGFRSLLELAGRSRVELAALAHAHERAVQRDAWDDARRIEALCEEAAGTSERVVRHLEGGSVRLQLRAAPEWHGLDSPAETDVRGLRPSVVTGATALRGLLRSAERIASGLANEHGPDLDGSDRHQLLGVEPVHVVPGLREPLATLRAAVRTRSDTLRHAVRLAAVVGAASIAYRLLDLDHGYWVALTALFVLRPDYASTLRRGAARIVGTSLGAAGATLLAAYWQPTELALVPLIAACALGAYTSFRANQALFSTFLTGYVVLLLSLLGLPSVEAGATRLADTVAGGCLALAGYLLWPTWERSRLPDRLADLVDAQGAYAAALLAAYASGGGDRRKLAAAQTRARDARAAAEASAERFAGEPVTRQGEAGRAAQVRLAEGVVAAGQRTAQALLALHARVPTGPTEAVPAALALGPDLLAAAEAVSAALRGGGPAPDLDAVAASVERTAAEAGDATVQQRLLALETAVVVEALRSVAAALEQATPPR